MQWRLHKSWRGRSPKSNMFQAFCRTKLWEHILSQGAHNNLSILDRHNFAYMSIFLFDHGVHASLAQLGTGALRSTMSTMFMFVVRIYMNCDSRGHGPKRREGGAGRRPSSRDLSPGEGMPIASLRGYLPPVGISFFR